MGGGGRLKELHMLRYVIFVKIHLYEVEKPTDLK